MILLSSTALVLESPKQDVVPENKELAISLENQRRWREKSENIQELEMLAQVSEIPPKPFQ